MRILYINYLLGAELDFEMITPSGDIITNFADTIINFDSDEISNCVEVTALNTYSTSTTASIGSTSSTEYSIGSTTVTSGTSTYVSTHVVQNLVYTTPETTIMTASYGLEATTYTTTGVITEGTSVNVAVYVVEEEIVPSSLLSSYYNAHPTASPTSSSSSSTLSSSRAGSSVSSSVAVTSSSSTETVSNLPSNTYIYTHPGLVAHYLKPELLLVISLAVLVLIRFKGLCLPIMCQVEFLILLWVRLHHCRFHLLLSDRLVVL